MKWDIYEEPHKLFCDDDSEVAVDSFTDFIEFLLLLKEDELVIGVGAGLEFFDDGGTAVFDYHVFEAQDGGEDGLFEDVVFGSYHYAMTLPVVEFVLSAEEVGRQHCHVLVFA